MTDELYAEAYRLQKEVADLKALLKDKEAELEEVISQIRRDGVKGMEYALEIKTKPSRTANTAWFRKEHPEFYNKSAHVSHPVAVSLMSDICGGYMELQGQIREARPDEFHQNAIINLADIQGEFGEEEVEELECIGAITVEKAKSFKVVMLPQYLIDMNRKAAKKAEVNQ